MGGVDSDFSLEPDEFKMLVSESKRAFESIGKINYGITGSEKKVDAGKRSIYASKDIKIGDKFNKSNIKIIRPGLGLHLEIMKIY